jgi:hypothetical protein
MLVLAVQAGLLAMHGLSSTTMPANAPMSVMVTMPAGQSSHSTQRAANADT